MLCSYLVKSKYDLLGKLIRYENEMHSCKVAERLYVVETFKTVTPCAHSFQPNVKREEKFVHAHGALFVFVPSVWISMILILRKLCIMQNRAQALIWWVQ